MAYVSNKMKETYCLLGGHSRLLWSEWLHWGQESRAASVFGFQAQNI